MCTRIARTRRDLSPSAPWLAHHTAVSGGSMAIRDWPEEDRRRGNLLAHAADRLTDAELLAILFGTGCSGQSAVDLGGALIREFGSLRGLLSADRRRCSAT